MISRHMEHGWSGILELRNMLVHNNAIAERTQAFELPGGPTLAFAEGRHDAWESQLLPKCCFGQRTPSLLGRRISGSRRAA